MNTIEIQKLLLKHLNLGEHWESVYTPETCWYLGDSFVIRFGDFGRDRLAVFFWTGIWCAELEQVLKPIFESQNLFQGHLSFSFNDRVGIGIGIESGLEKVAEDLRPKFVKRLEQLEKFRSYQWIARAMESEQWIDRELDGKRERVNLGRFPILRLMILKKLAGEADYQKFSENVLNKSVKERWLTRHAEDFEFAQEVYDRLERRGD